MTASAGVETSLAREGEAQSHWCLQPQFASLKSFDQILHNEFLSRDEQRRRQTRALCSMVSFAVAEVPYYRDLFAARGLRAADIRGIEDLARLPLLSKQDIRAHPDRLRPPRLPRGESLYGAFSSSGTTGQPARIFHTVSSNAMFTFLAQRQYRWFRFDPRASIAVIRLASQLPRLRGAGLNPDGQTQRLAHWRYVGRFFETGPALGFNITNPIERQLEWLSTERPVYLVSYSESLEHLCFASGRSRPVASIEGLQAISEQLTPSMRRGIEATFAAPVHQNYGLNEVGLVAVRCRAGRYHVHAEHCLVEIVNGDGQACKPGETGRMAITALQNRAMPLIRYDSDDLAQAVAGPCPCGRSLPSFGDIVGRYSRIAWLPEGTLGLVAAVREALETMPRPLALDLRRFQLHQSRAGGFTLRLASTGPLPAAFHERVNSAWRAAAGDRADSLEILEVMEIPREPSGKFQDFTSDYMPAADREPMDTK